MTDTQSHTTHDDTHDVSHVDSDQEVVVDSSADIQVPVSGDAVSVESLLVKISALEKSLREQEEITKKAQYDYVTLKLDFDRYQRHMEEQQKTLSVDMLIQTVQKFLPFLEGLRKSLSTIRPELLEDPLVQWVQMTYDKFVQTLSQMSIVAIDSVGKEPDSLLHEPVGMQPVEDPTQKGKIVQEFSQGFVYRKGDVQKVVVTAKVVVGQ